MEIGRTQVVDLMTMRMPVPGIIAPTMVMVLTIVMTAVMEQPCARQIDEQAQNGHGDGLVELDRDRRGQAEHGLEADQQGDDGQDDRARISGQLSEQIGRAYV